MSSRNTLKFAGEATEGRLVGKYTDSRRNKIPFKDSSTKGNVSRQSLSTNPVCVHCRNIGLPFDHWLRATVEPNSPVVCPVLLKTECRYCHEFGHTVGRCPKTMKDGMEQNAGGKEEVLPAKAKNTSKPPVRNRGGFAALDSSDSEIEDGEIKEDLPKKRPSSENIEKPVYRKKVVERRQVVPVPTFVESDFPSLYVPYVPYILTEQECMEVDAMVEARRILFTSGKSWADICCDSDEE